MEPNYKHKYYAMVEHYKDLLEQYDNLMDREHKLYEDFLKIKMSIVAGDVPDALLRTAVVKDRYRDGFAQPEEVEPAPVYTKNITKRRYGFE
tara:strand:- start:262 stop:537 length:276 start_codon:yes stop_codon:yes gene_type:complete